MIRKHETNVATGTDAVRHPDIRIPDLDSIPGNVYAALVLVKRAMRKAGVPEDEIKRYREEAMAGYGSGAMRGDYGLFVLTTGLWVSVDRKNPCGKNEQRLQ